jgi:hypothetical protein
MSHLQASHSPFDAAIAHLSRRSAGSGRPSKSQRLSGAGGGSSSGAIHKPAHHASASLHASPRASPRPSPRGSFLAGEVLATLPYMPAKWGCAVDRGAEFTTVSDEICQLSKVLCSPAISISQAAATWVAGLWQWTSRPAGRCQTLRPRKRLMSRSAPCPGKACCLTHGIPIRCCMFWSRAAKSGINRDTGLL